MQSLEFWREENIACAGRRRSGCEKDICISGQAMVYWCTIHNEGIIDMRILFFRPKSGYYPGLSPQPPLGSLALASFAQMKGHTVRIFDRQANHGSFMKAVASFQPDVVAVTLTVESMIPDAIRVSRGLKERGLPVLWGGHMASAIPEEIVRSGYVDYVGISEGEYTLMELLEVLEGKRTPDTVRGIAYVDENGVYRRTEDRSFADLADFPPLDYSLIPVERFHTKTPYANRAFTVIASKGCPFSCTYCFNHEFHRCQLREYPRDIVFQQIKTLKENYHVNGIMFPDELFGINKQQMRLFCKEMKCTYPGITWGTETKIGTLSREDLELIYNAGCRALSFGVESGNAEMRKKLHKHYDEAKLYETFRNCHEIGIMTLANIMIGLPDETSEQLRDTVRLYFRAHPHVVSTALFTAIPGTQIYRSLEADGRISPIKKTLDEIGKAAKERQHLTKNYSKVPDKDLLVVMHYFHWQVVFGKKVKVQGMKQESMINWGIVNMLGLLRSVGVSGIARWFWESVKLFCTVAWYAHAYPSIRKKYDLSAKNFGRTDWD